MMLRILLATALFVVAGCSPEGGTANHLPAGSGPVAPVGTTAGVGAAGGQATAGTAPLGAGRAAPGSAGTAAISGMGAQGGAGAAAPRAGTGGQGTAGRVAAGTGASSAGTGAAGAAGNGGTASGTVTVEFTTVSYGGEYAPLNYGAVWFESGSGGGFLKTAKRWAGAAHATDLVGWTAASGGWGSLFLPMNMADQMDAVSSATIRTHQAHTVTWNMMNVQKQRVPDGQYVAVVEMSESRAITRAGPLLRIPFTKGPNPQMVAVPNDASFTGVVLRYTP